MSNTDFNPALVGIQILTTYLPTHSRPEDDQYTFAYTITISNASDQPVQLLSRHWVFTDANNSVQEVRGEGVVGEQPVIAPDQSFRYTSGETLPPPVGYMEGRYPMIIPEGEVDLTEQPAFEVPIPAFTLHTPTALN